MEEHGIPTVVAKRLDGSRCQLIKRQASAQATLCKMGTQPHHSSFFPLSAHAYCGQTVAHLSNCWALVSTYNIASSSAFYPSPVQKNPQNHPHFTRLKIRKSANPQFTRGLLTLGYRAFSLPESANRTLANSLPGQFTPLPLCITWGSSSPKRGTFPPIFGSCLLMPNGCPSQILLSTC